MIEHAQLFRALRDFEWGSLRIRQGEVIAVEHTDERTATAYLERDPGHTQIISREAIESMRMLGNMENK